MNVHKFSSPMKNNTIKLVLKIIFSSSAIIFILSQIDWKEALLRIDQANLLLLLLAFITLLFYPITEKTR